MKRIDRRKELEQRDLDRAKREHEAFELLDRMLELMSVLGHDCALMDRVEIFLLQNYSPPPLGS